MNKQLESLYTSHWDALITGFNTTGKSVAPAAQPLLIKVNNEYENADFKVVIYGQETDGWGKNFTETQLTIHSLMNMYHNYFYSMSDNGRKKVSRPFWSKRNFGFFEKHLKIPNKKVAFLWNNISKIGNFDKGKGRPDQSIKQLERNYFNIIEQELFILEPDLVIFTTGKRDSYIKHHFGSNTEFLPKLYDRMGNPLVETINLIAEVRLENCPDIKAIRVETLIEGLSAMSLF